jgi:4-diphosphocytidyl-2-C-methyl-D-erythritol kinase
MNAPSGSRQRSSARWRGDWPGEAARAGVEIGPVRLRALAPGKINLCLFLGGVRDDGRHELVTVFESVSLADELVMSQAAGPGDEVICPGVPEPNLVTRALEGLRARGWSAPPVRVTVEKRVPVAAGMGGGSADAAATLRLAARLEAVPWFVLSELAAGLGADVPSQLAPGLALGTGAGDIVQPLRPLGPHAFVILPQPIALATADVYREADRLGLPRPAENLRAVGQELVAALGSAGELPAELLTNDLAVAARSLCPAIDGALEAARESGAGRAIVCGSGPTVAGIYWGADALHRATEAADGLSDRFPGAAAVVPVDSMAAAAVSEGRRSQFP